VKFANIYALYISLIPYKKNLDFKSSKLSGANNSKKKKVKLPNSIYNAQKIMKMLKIY
jgi:hypothetical protein